MCYGLLLQSHLNLSILVARVMKYSHNKESQQRREGVDAYEKMFLYGHNEKILYYLQTVFYHSRDITKCHFSEAISRRVLKLII